MTEVPRDIPLEKPFRELATVRNSLAKLGLKKDYFGEAPLSYAAALGLKRLAACLEACLSNFKPDIQSGRKRAFFEHSDPDLVRELVANFPVNTSMLNSLLHLQLYLVNRGVLEAVCRGQSDVFIQARKAIDAGEFDREDGVHEALEFARYHEHTKGGYAQFAALPNQADVMLNTQQTQELEAMSEDNLKLLAWLKAEAMKGPCTVIFNQRYGDNYVGQLIKPRLRHVDGVTTREEYVHSFHYDVDADDKAKWDLVTWLSEEAKAALADPDMRVIVVDGSRNNEAGAGNQMLRLPRSMRAFELMAERHDRELQVWSPAEGLMERAFIGDPDRDKFSELDLPLQTTKAPVTLVSITAGESDGILDNPDDVAAKKTLCLGPKGFTKARTAIDEDTLVKHVQAAVREHMKAALK